MLSLVHWFRAALPVLEKEYRFWKENRSVALEVNGKKHVLNRYNVQVNFPRYVENMLILGKDREETDISQEISLHLNSHYRSRPESYTDDLELAEGLTDGK